MERSEREHGMDGQAAPGRQASKIPEGVLSNERRRQLKDRRGPVMC